MRPGGGLAGTAFWLIAAPSYPDHDGFTVYFSSSGSNQPSSSSSGRELLTPQGGRPLGAHGSRTAAVVRQHAAAVARLCQQGSAVAGPPLPPASTANPLLAGGAGAGAAAAHGHSSGGSGHGSHSSPCPCCPQM